MLLESTGGLRLYYMMRYLLVTAAAAAAAFEDRMILQIDPRANTDVNGQ